MKLRTFRHRITAPGIGVAVAPALGVSALSYTNGFSLLAATAVGTATMALALWALATEP